MIQKINKNLKKNMTNINSKDLINLSYNNSEWKKLYFNNTNKLKLHFNKEKFIFELKFKLKIFYTNLNLNLFNVFNLFLIIFFKKSFFDSKNIFS